MKKKILVTGGLGFIGSNFIRLMLKKHKNIPLWKKIKWVFVEWEGKWSWSLAAIIITILGRLPLMLADTQVKTTLLAHSAPLALQWLMSIATIGLIFSAILSTAMLPPRPAKHHWLMQVVMVLQWVLFPASMLIFGAIPATEAQTRLMLGKYLGFWVTEKKRTDDKPALATTS